MWNVKGERRSTKLKPRSVLYADSSTSTSLSASGRSVDDGGRPGGASGCAAGPTAATAVSAEDPAAPFAGAPPPAGAAWPAEPAAAAFSPLSAPVSGMSRSKAHGKRSPARRYAPHLLSL